jgi:hypothetical protein
MRDKAIRRKHSRSPIWLRLTNAAEKHLLDDGGDRSAANARMQGDLSGEVFASFKMDKESGEPVRDVVFLVGNDHRYTLKLDDLGNAYVVTAAARPEFEVLEAFRRRSVSLPPVFSWVVREPVNREQSQRALATFVGLLDDYLEVVRQGPSQPIRDGDELFDLWLRILDAREDLARGELHPMQYRSWKPDGPRTIFTLAKPNEVDLVGTEWQIQEPRSNRKYGWGEVVDGDESTVTLFGKRHTALPPAATLVPHIGPSEVSLARQREAVTAIKAGTNLRATLREVLLDPSANEAPITATVMEWELNLDQSKREAVELALGARDVLLIEGPPGTGKTSFIAEVVAQTLRSNPKARILIASQTHVAVDNALERLDRAGIRGLVRLAGQDESRVDKSVRHLLLDTQTKRWARGVRKKAEASIDEHAARVSIDPDHLRAALILKELATVSRQIEDIGRHIVHEGVGDSEESALSTAFDLPRANTGMQEQMDGLADLRLELVKSAQSSLAGDLTIPTGIGESEANSAIDALLGDGNDVKDLLKHLALQAEWLQRIDADDSLTAVFLETTSVVAGTCTGFLRNRAVKLLEFDLCIVDEASKATFTEALVPMSRARRWILVGDTRQLPPVDEDLLRADSIMREHDITPHDVTQTLFQHMADLLPAHSQRELRDQYRMIRPIGDLISTCFYDGKLRSPKTQGLEGYEKLLGSAVMWMDTMSLGEKRRESAPGGQATSYANRAEAQLVVSRLITIEGAIERGVVKPPDGRMLEVLVIAPYKSQVDELQRRIAPIRLTNLSIAVMSVDSVQGREADIVLFSVTRSNPDRKLGFLGADYWRRINVALSRARFGLTIFGDASFIRGTNGALRTVLDYIAEHSTDCELRMAEVE